MLEFVFISVVVFAFISIVQKSRGLFIKSIPQIVIIQLIIFFLKDKNLILRSAVFSILLLFSAVILIHLEKQHRKEEI